MNLRHLLRMSKFARNPPSDKRVKLVFGVILTCVILFGIERLIGWPDWLTLDKPPRAPKLR